MDEAAAGADQCADNPDQDTGMKNDDRHQEAHRHMFRDDGLRRHATSCRQEHHQYEQRRQNPFFQRVAPLSVISRCGILFI